MPIDPFTGRRYLDEDPFADGPTWLDDEDIFLGDPDGFLDDDDDEWEPLPDDADDAEE